MRRAVFLLLVAGVFGSALTRPNTDSNENKPRLQERQSRLQEEGHRLQEDSPHLQDDNNAEEDASEHEHQEFENDQDDEEVGDDLEEGNREEAEELDETIGSEVDNDMSSENDDGDESKTAGSDKTHVTTSSPESKVLQTGNTKRKRKNSGPSKKMASKLLPLLMIPLMIQAQLIPMMLLKLKLMALKALMLGKAALVIILLNLLRNSFLGANTMEEQYEQQTLASHHYGYSGGPEYGAWINKRVYNPELNHPYRGHQFEASHEQQGTAGRPVLSHPALGLDEKNT